jgi:predicted metal-dependent HD superfamily phosphohydrolase
MLDFLKHEWFQLASKLTKNDTNIELRWIEIKTQYQLKIRHYHNLFHIESMLKQANKNKHAIKDYDALLLAIWYHDIIYKPTKKNNEEQSALFAEKRLKSFNIDEKTSNNVAKLINSTKKHEIVLDENLDNAYLLDIDLSILGSPWENYQNYIKNIRKEYHIYPNLLYNKGRKQVLQHFLERDTLFFTETYQSNFESKARQNILKEIELL